VKEVNVVEEVNMVLYKNEYRIFKPAEITIRRRLSSKEEK
jgi:hypothetical protein